MVNVNQLKIYKLSVNPKIKDIYIIKSSERICYDGWLFQCYFCGTMTSNVITINNIDGTVRSNVCPNCCKKSEELLSKIKHKTFDYYNK